MLHEAEGPWAGAPKGFWTQITLWYLVCGVWKLGFCNNGDVWDLGYDATVERFTGDLVAFLLEASAFCNSAESYGCFVSPSLFEPTTNAYVDRFVEGVRDALETAATPKIMLLDVNTLSAGLSAEVGEGHWSPKLALWAMHIILNAVCPSYPASGCRSFVPDVRGLQPHQRPGRAAKGASARTTTRGASSAATARTGSAPTRGPAPTVRPLKKSMR